MRPKKCNVHIVIRAVTNYYFPIYIDLYIFQLIVQRTLKKEEEEKKR